MAEPHPRAFMAALFRDTSAVTINNMYSINSKGKSQDDEIRLQKQIKRLQARLQELREEKEKDEELD